MEPTMKEIADLCREAVLDYRAQALACCAGVLPARFKGEMLEKAERFEAAAAQIEAMGDNEPSAWLRVSNISNNVTGVFLTDDVELRSERLLPLFLTRAGYRSA